MIEIVEAVIQFYKTEDGGRKSSLWPASLKYLPHFRVTPDSELPGVRLIGGPQEIKPGDKVTVQAHLIYPQVPYNELIVGQSFFLCEGPQPIGEGTITRRWREQIDKPQFRQIQPDNWGPTIDEVRLWAYDENAWLTGQDEDLIFLDPYYIPILLELISDEACPKQDLALSYLTHCTGHLVAEAKDRSDKTIIMLEGMAEVVQSSNNKGLQEWAEYLFLRIEEL